MLLGPKVQILDVLCARIYAHIYILAFVLLKYQCSTSISLVIAAKE